VVINNQPAPTTIPVHETEPRWAKDLLPIVHLGKSVCPGVDRHIAIDANSLLTKDSFI
jgi:hypothetical protein